MPSANIHRRNTLEEIYPPEAFASDAAQNGRAPNDRLRGVRVLSAPDAAGDFDLEPAAQQVGEAASARFLAPHRPQQEIGDADRTSADPQAGYQAFLADIIAAAQRFGFKSEESPGRDEPRLRGLRQ